MQELSLNFPTVVILLVILALAVLAIRRMTRRGLCDCGDHCGDGEGGCAGCSHCASARRPDTSGGADGAGAGDGAPMLPGSRGYGPSRRQDLRGGKAPRRP